MCYTLYIIYILYITLTRDHFSHLLFLTFLQNLELYLYVMLVMTEVHSTWLLPEILFNRPSVSVTSTPVLTTKTRTFHWILRHKTSNSLIRPFIFA